MIAAGVVLVIVAFGLTYTQFSVLGLVVFPAGLVLVAAGAMNRYVARRAVVREAALAGGVPGIARVVGMRRTEPASRGARQVNVQLEVRLPERSPYRASVSPTLPASIRLGEGDMILVRVVPERRFDVHFDVAPQLPVSLELPSLPPPVEALPLAGRLAHVRQHGVPATAAVLGVAALGENLYRLTVDITPAGGEPVPTTDVAVLSPADLHPGAVLPARLMRRASGAPVIAVLFDPEDPSAG